MHIYDHIHRILAALPAPLFLAEIGGCDGGDSARLHDALVAASKPFEMLTIEPVARNFQTLLRRIAGRKEIRALHCAVGQVTGPVDFYDSVTPEYYGSSSIRAPKESLTIWPTMKFEKTKAECVTLDALVGHRERIDFIWADVQGAEIDLIMGGPQALAKTRYLYTEFSDKELYEGEIKLPEILQMLPDWEIVEQYDHDVLLKNVRI